MSQLYTQNIAIEVKRTIQRRGYRRHTLPSESEALDTQKLKTQVKPKVLDPARCQNTAITIKKIKLKAREVSSALLRCDVNVLSAEKIDLVALIMPNKEVRSSM